MRYHCSQQIKLSEGEMQNLFKSTQLIGEVMMSQIRIPSICNNVALPFLTFFRYYISYLVLAVLNYPSEKENLIDSYIP